MESEEDEFKAMLSKFRVYEFKITISKLAHIQTSNKIIHIDMTSNNIIYGWIEFLERQINELSDVNLFSEVINYYDLQHNFDIDEEEKILRKQLNVLITNNLETLSYISESAKKLGNSLIQKLLNKENRK